MIDLGLRPADGLERDRGPSLIRASRDLSVAELPTETKPSTRRRMLWEIWDGYHCSICGTCLSFEELGKIAAKAGIRFEPDESEHGIHGHFVQLAGKAGRVAKLIHKILDRKYRSAVDRFRRAKSDTQVAELWDRALAEGDVPGPYWALMTHPRATPPLMVRAFGEVHMLSHLAGATNRADIRRLQALESERRELSERLAAMDRRLSEREDEHRRHEREQDALARELRSRLQAARSRLEDVEGRLRESEDGEALRAARARNGALESELAAAKRARRNESQRRSVLEEELAELRSTHDEMSITVRTLSAECDALESLVQSGVRDSGGSTAGLDAEFDLRRRRIAYVGGRPGTVGHIRALVERLNGSFIYHDGGIEDHEGQLGRVLGQADVVLCPVDCVSHRASLRAKQFCKRTAKPFVPLRSTGLSSVASGLRQATGRHHGPQPPDDEGSLYGESPNDS